MLNGSSWGAEKAFLEERREELDVFVAIEHRLRGKAADQEWNVFAKVVFNLQQRMDAAELSQMMEAHVRRSH